jgi:hypothetical protein
MITLPTAPVVLWQDQPIRVMAIQRKSRRVGSARETVVTTVVLFQA